MTLTTIMVYVDFDETMEDRVSVAAGIALRFNALLIGVAGWSLRQSDTASSVAKSSPAVDGRQETISEQLKHLEERFRRCAGAIPRGVEWRSSTGFPREVIPAEARAADLVIIGQEEIAGDTYHTYDPGTIILAAGRPVLVVPREIRRLDASRVLIAWKDTREARRAVRDALPLLKEAKSVIR